MDNQKNSEQQENNIEIKEKNTVGGCLFSLTKGLIITIAVTIGLIILGVITIKIIDHIPRTIDEQSTDGYTIYLQATSSPDFPFGSQDGRIVLKDDKDKKICKVDFRLSNDGKGMTAYNWSVEWKDEEVIVTIIGEEQEDEIYHLYYNGETE